MIPNLAPAPAPIPPRGRPPEAVCATSVKPSHAAHKCHFSLNNTAMSPEAADVPIGMAEVIPAKEG